MFRELVGSVRKSLGFQLDQKAIPLSDPAISELFGALPTASGVSVTAHTALRVPAVLQAVRLIAETVGSLPCKLYRDADGSKEAAKDHGGNRLAHNRVNGWTSAGHLRTLLTTDALLHGAGYAHVVRTGDGRPYEINRLKPSAVQRRFRDDGEPFYVVTFANNVRRELPFRDVLYVPAFGDTSPVQLGKEAIGVSMLLERHAAQFFGSGARPAAVITNDAKMGGEQGVTTLANIRKSFREWLSGSSSDPLILDSGWKFDQPAMTSTDAQFLEHRVEQVREIARIFGVPSSMLFELSRATWSNAEQMAASFLQLCLRPWLDRWQDAYATVLLTEEEQDSLYFEFVIDDLQRADAAGRAEIFGKLVAMRAMTPNEVRSAMNLPAIEGGDELANPYTTTGPAAGANDDNPSTDKEAA
ncbi:HK97 family phage portal protein [Bosea robiniae]|uniref:phage portal protein n=1 Tax=Bosea TaxID=85413 RepID=UPI0028679ADF|nr:MULTISPECIES: phage portal protein [Bosea]MDR6831349.1 HK97 family phage portal protein [Bosea robiniae]MDR6898083.1 HK97 family phage portal protein [Bosea sp. BE109]MDR7141486.1 HK97 family phage portal protein [Bosea sp. BE168]